MQLAGIVAGKPGAHALAQNGISVAGAIEKNSALGGGPF